jgi:hypothetical protein
MPYIISHYLRYIVKKVFEELAEEKLRLDLGEKGLVFAQRS